MKVFGREECSRLELEEAARRKVELLSMVG